MKKHINGNDLAMYILATIIVVGFFILLIYLIRYTLPKDSTGVVFMLFGALASAFGAVVNYFFGSSSGSAAKTDIISKSPPIVE